jgi:hypothetical protein
VSVWIVLPPWILWEAVFVSLTSATVSLRPLSHLHHSFQNITALCASSSLTPHLINLLDGYARSNIFWFLIRYSYYRKTFTVWMLFCRFACNKMFNTKSMVSFCYIVLPSYKVQRFLSDRWCFFLCWKGGNHTPARPFISTFHSPSRRNCIPRQHTNTT